MVLELIIYHIWKRYLWRLLWSSKFGDTTRALNLNDKMKRQQVTLRDGHRGELSSFAG